MQNDLTAKMTSIPQVCVHYILTGVSHFGLITNYDQSLIPGDIPNVPIVGHAYLAAQLDLPLMDAYVG